MVLICSESATQIEDDRGNARKPTRGKKFHSCSFENQEDEFIKVSVQNLSMRSKQQMVMIANHEDKYNNVTINALYKLT